MAHDPGPAPVTTLLPRGVPASVHAVAIAVMLLALCAPVFGQSRDAAVMTQDLLAKCQDLFNACAKACRNAPVACSICEKERALCTAEVYANATPSPREPAGWVVPGGPTIFIPPIPGISNSTSPRPWPPSTIPVVLPDSPKPVPQSREHCDPNNYDAVLERYQDQNGGGPTSESLQQEIETKQAELEQKIEAANAAVSAAETAKEKKQAELQLAQLQQVNDALSGTGQLLAGLDPNAPDHATVLVGLKMTLDKLMKDGLQPRSGRAGIAVGSGGSDADVINSIATSYHDKQNSLGRVLAGNGAGARELAGKTGRETLLSLCHGEPMGAPPSAKAETPGECQGQPFDVATQCCTEEGIGTPVAKEVDEIASCPPEKRSPKPGHVPAKNGCGNDKIVSLIGDFLDNTCLRFNPTVKVKYRFPFSVRVRVSLNRTCPFPSFVPACDFHDACWGTCNTPQTGTSQEACDTEFGERIEQICEGANLSADDLKVCYRFAKGYQAGVAIGQMTMSAYDSGQAEACNCCEGAG